MLRREPRVRSIEERKHAARLAAEHVRRVLEVVADERLWVAVAVDVMDQRRHAHVVAQARLGRCSLGEAIGPLERSPLREPELGRSRVRAEQVRVAPVDAVGDPKIEAIVAVDVGDRDRSRAVFALAKREVERAEAARLRVEAVHAPMRARGHVVRAHREEIEPAVAVEVGEGQLLEIARGSVSEERARAIEEGEALALQVDCKRTPRGPEDHVEVPVAVEVADTDRRVGPEVVAELLGGALERRREDVGHERSFPRARLVEAVTRGARRAGRWSGVAFPCEVEAREALGIVADRRSRRGLSRGRSADDRHAGGRCLEAPREVRAQVEWACPKRGEGEGERPRERATGSRPELARVGEA